MMTRFSTKTSKSMIGLLLLCSSCTVITHVDEFEATEGGQCEEEPLHYSGALICYEDIPSEIKTCMDQELNRSLSEECAYCRCKNCAVQFENCGLKCWEIVACALRNRCDRDDMSSCVVKNCRVVLDLAQVGIEQASALAVCAGGCNDFCLEQ